MTTSENNANESEEIQLRPIEELLKLQSYSLMSDAEVEVVMEYRAKVAAAQAVTAVLDSTAIESMKQLADQWKQNAAAAKTHRQEIVEKGLNLETISEAEA